MNNTPKHTPGPWVHYPTDLNNHIEDDRGNYVASLYRRITDSETTANAYLIAAAPELLDMLYTVLPAVEESDEFNKPSMKLAPKVRALILKAGGAI